jgi:hypothetical protein
MLSPRDLQGALPLETHRRAAQTATIQLLPDRKGLCQTLLFHNDTGHFEGSGKDQCRDLIPENMLVWTQRARSARIEALSRAFKFR